MRSVSPEQHSKKQQQKRLESVGEAESWLNEANSDEAESLPRAGAATENELRKVSYRLHIDLIQGLKTKAKIDIRNEVDVVRQYLIEGLRRDGIKIGQGD